MRRYLIERQDVRGDAASGAINRPRDAAVTSLGEIWMVGDFDGTVDFGTGPMTSDAVDTYIVRFDP